MADCWEILNADLANWTPGARFFATDDDTYFIIDADLEPAPGWVSTVIRRRTAVFYCTDTAGVTDLNADHEFPPGTTPEQAVELMGHTLTDPPITELPKEGAPE